MISLRCALSSSLICLSLFGCGPEDDKEKKGAESAGTSSQQSKTTVQVDAGKPVPTAGETLKEFEQAEKTLNTADDLSVRVNRVALAYAAEGHFGDAEKLLQRLVALLEKPQLASEAIQLAASMNNLGLLYMQQKKYGKAEPLFQKSLVLQQRILGQSDPGFAGSISNLATLYYEQARYKDALPLFSRAMAIYKLRPVHNALAVAKSVNNVAGCYSNLKNYPEAEKYFKEALAIEEKLPANAAGLAAALNNLGYVYVVQNKFDKAEPLLKRALQIAEKIYDDKAMELISFLDNNAYLLRKTNRAAEADKLKARTKQILVANDR